MIMARTGKSTKILFVAIGLLFITGIFVLLMYQLSTRYLKTKIEGALGENVKAGSVDIIDWNGQTLRNLW